MAALTDNDGAYAALADAMARLAPASVQAEFETGVEAEVDTGIDL